MRPVASRSGQFKPFTMRIDQAPFSDVFSPYDPGFDKPLHRQQDIPQAKSLLKKAGLENMTVTLTTSAVATGMVAMATVLAEQATAAGVTIKIHQVDPGTFFGANYLSWTFSQDYYSYAPYLNQVAQLTRRPIRPRASRSSMRCSNSISARAPISSPRSWTRSTHTATRSPVTPPRASGGVGEPLSNWDMERFWFV